MPQSRATKSAFVFAKGSAGSKPAAVSTRNIVQTAITIIAGQEKNQIAKAARILRLSESTLYRWVRKGNLQDARGIHILHVHELTRIPLELLLQG